MNAKKKRIGEMLLEAGIIDETQLKAALGHQRQWGVRLGQALVDLKLATEADIVRALSLKFGFEVAKLDALEPYGHEQALKLFTREFTVRNNVFPIWADMANVTVAMSDPTNLAVADEIRFRTGRRVKVCIGGDREIAEALKGPYPPDGTVEAIALDLDGDVGIEGEAVFDPFGGGSTDALDAFFGGDAAPSDELERADALEPAPALAPVAPAPAARAAPATRTASAVRAQGQASVATARPPAPAAARPAAPAPPRPAPAPTAARAAAKASPPPAAARPSPTALAAAVPKPEAPAARPRRAIELDLEAAPPARARPEADAEELTPLEDGPQNEPILASDLAPGEGNVDSATRDLSPRELAILESLDRLADGAPVEPELVKPAQAMAAMLRLLIRKRIVSEQEFLDELSKK